MSISIVFARALLAEVRERSGASDGDALLRRCGIEPERLAVSHAAMTLEECAALIAEVVELTKDPGLGLTVGASAPKAMLQVLGHLLCARRTVRDAFDSFQRYSTLLDGGVEWALEESGDTAAFIGMPPFQLGAYVRTAMEFSLAMAFRFGQQFAGPQARALSVQFRHAEPPYAQRYRDFFGCAVQFEQARYALVFPRAYLDRPQPHADAVMHVELERLADEMLVLRAQTDRISERVRMHIRHQPRFPNVDYGQLAARMGTSLRTLRRRLRAEGTSLSTLVTEARCEVACETLSRTDRSVRRTAQLLGFSEPSSFYRAFKRWTGTTPLEFRRDARVTQRQSAAR
ncbi:MAG TPA: AraC family transcriptional regulator [Polyangiales bacterium]|nr:AraC family transcriptional regulator [Polyangiales bacterium]